MGTQNAAAGFSRALSAKRPNWVITCGFAGGLNPAHGGGAILHQTDDQALDAAARTSGSSPGRFLHAERVLATAREKAAAFQTSGADAVEMESSAIRSLCAEAGLPCLIMRTISDPAREDLPLDFNAFMRADQNLDYPRLLWHLACHPGKVPDLVRFQQRINAAARALARTLTSVYHQLLETQRPI
jgi:adenosylhomocysteine nucleosidase